MCTPGSSAPPRAARHSRDKQNPSANAAPTKRRRNSPRRETSLETAKAIDPWPLRAPSRSPRTATQLRLHTASRATWDNGISLGLRVGSHNTIVFTKVFDYVPRGVVEEDEIPPEPADRAKWERKSSAAILQLVDQCLIILKGIDSKLELNYTVSYIGLSKDRQPFNFVTFQPRRHVLNITLNIPRSADVDQKIEDSGIETLEYRHERYRLALRNEEISKNKELLKELMELAYIYDLSLQRTYGNGGWSSGSRRRRVHVTDWGISASVFLARLFLVCLSSLTKVPYTRSFWHIEARRARPALSSMPAKGSEKDRFGGVAVRGYRSRQGSNLWSKL